MIEILEAAIKQLQEPRETNSNSICIGHVGAMELFDTLTSSNKWYHGIGIDRHHASRIIKKHKAGTYKNYKWIFTKFGYKSIEVIYKLNNP